MGVSGGVVETWGDLSGKNRNYSAPVGNEPNYIVSDVNWDGKPSISWTGALKWLESDDVAGTWNFLHDGTGGCVFTVYRVIAGTEMLLANSGSAAQVGIRLFGSVAGNQRISVAAAGAPLVVSNDIANVFNTKLYGMYAYLEGRPGNEWRHDVLGVSNTGDSTNAPSASDPAALMHIGIRTTEASQAMNGEIMEVIFASVYPTTQQFSLMAAYLLARYGLS
ncbi:hypothetical protein LCGC14_2768980 [marine sediment metagenome]|uniref:Uncharacterized protein n=1 Tax=marine sediment metagenome TaxID=412755 RepID=A0A0F9B5K9_9ZZZZ